MDAAAVAAGVSVASTFAADTAATDTAATDTAATTTAAAAAAAAARTDTADARRDRFCCCLCGGGVGVGDLPARTGVILPRAMESCARLLHRPDFFSRYVEHLVERPNPLEERIVQSILASCVECCRHWGDDLERAFRRMEEDRLDPRTLCTMAAAFEAYVGLGVKEEVGGEEEREEVEDVEEEEEREEVEDVEEEEEREEVEVVEEEEEEEEEVEEVEVVEEEEEDETSDDEGVCMDAFNFRWAHFVVYLLVTCHLFHKTARKYAASEARGEEEGEEKGEEEEASRVEILYGEQNLFRVVATSVTRAFEDGKIVERMEPLRGWRGFLRFDRDRITNASTFREWMDEKMNEQ